MRPDRKFFATQKNRTSPTKAPVPYNKTSPTNLLITFAQRSPDKKKAEDGCNMNHVLYIARAASFFYVLTSLTTHTRHTYDSSK